MRNLDQIRAENAIKQAGNTYKGQNDGNIVKKVPTMIQQCGLLSTLAFANEKGKDGYANVLKACITHLHTLQMTALAGSDPDINAFSSELCKGSSDNLRAVTAEILAYLNYLRRYAAK